MNIDWNEDVVLTWTIQIFLKHHKQSSLQGTEFLHQAEPVQLCCSYDIFLLISSSFSSSLSWASYWLYYSRGFKHMIGGGLVPWEMRGIFARWEGNQHGFHDKPSEEKNVNAKVVTSKSKSYKPKVKVCQNHNRYALPLKRS